MIRFDKVTKSYAGSARPALNAVSLEISAGEFVFLVGASGSGKSSFLRLVLKEERPTKGDVHVLGQHLNTLASRKVPFFRRNLGVVFQDFRLLPQKTVFDNVAFTLQVIGKSRGFIQEAVPDVLRMVGLAGKQNRLPHELSGGEQQRVAIARAIVNKPAILLADEPTGNLDPATSAGIMSLLATINANGTTVVMATHDVGIVDQMRRRVIELIGGQVVRDERSGGYQTSAIPTPRPSVVQESRSPAPSEMQDPTRAAAASTGRSGPAPAFRPAFQSSPGAGVSADPAQPIEADAASGPAGSDAGEVPAEVDPLKEAPPLLPPGPPAAEQRPVPPTQRPAPEAEQRPVPPAQRPAPPRPAPDSAPPPLNEPEVRR